MLVEESRQAAPGEMGPRLRPPLPGDAPAVCRLIADDPAMDTNSLYCYVLQCTHFADTCAVAVDGRDDVVGWVSGYRHPADPRMLFVWQVAVREAARGRGLATRLIESVLARPACRDVVRIGATVTADNDASFALFEGLARRRGGGFRREPGFDRDDHFGGLHASELAVIVGPFAAADEAAIKPEEEWLRN